MCLRLPACNITNHISPVDWGEATRPPYKLRVALGSLSLTPTG